MPVDTNYGEYANATPVVETPKEEVKEDEKVEESAN